MAVDQWAKATATFLGFSPAALFFRSWASDAVATASEEAKNPEKTVPWHHPGSEHHHRPFHGRGLVTRGIVFFKDAGQSPNPSVRGIRGWGLWAAKIISIGTSSAWRPAMVLLLGPDLHPFSR